MTNITKSHIGLLTANLLWAFNYPLYHHILPQLATPLTLTTLAVIIAAIMAQIGDPIKHREKIDRKDIGKFIIAGLLMSVVRKLFLMSGMALTNPVDGSIIITLGPVLVLILSAAIGVEKLSTYKIIGVILGLAGVTVLILSSSSDVGGSEKMLGNFLVFICAASTAIYMVLFKGLINKYHPRTLMRWLYGMAAIIIIPIGAKDIIDTNFVNILHNAPFSLFYIITIPAYIPNILLLYSLKNVTPTISSIYNYIQPVVAAAIAIALGTDHLTPITAISSIIIFIGVLFVAKSETLHPLHK
ncbi:MAG: DMT family transporter [Bacteroidales bacterium]